MIGLHDDEWSSSQCALAEAYTAGFPLVMCVHGKIRSSVVGLAFTPGGIWWVDDGCMADFCPHHPDHFVECEITGDGPWHCGPDHVISCPDDDDPEYPAWRNFVDLAGGDVARVRQRMRELLTRRVEAQRESELAGRSKP